MNCEQAIQQVVLQSYGELSPEEQSALELHMHGCPECEAEREAMEAFAAEMAGEALPDVSPNLLAASRMRLDEALDQTPQLSLADRVRNFFGGTWHSLRRAPALALVLLGAGFLGGNAVSRRSAPPQARMPEPAIVQSSAAGTIRNVSAVTQTPNSEVVQVRYDRVVPETMQGSLDDPQIRQLLMNAAQHGADNAVREQSVGLLASECRAGHQCEGGSQTAVDGHGFRDALLVSLRYDKSPQVRLKALEGLQPFVRVDQRVRDAVLESLMRDSSPTVRTRAISLLEPVHADSSVRQVLHTVSTQDENPYIRTASMQALETGDEIQ